MFSDKIIPVSWIREKGKKKHPTIIDIRDKRKDAKI